MQRVNLRLKESRVCSEEAVLAVLLLLVVRASQDFFTLFTSQKVKRGFEIPVMPQHRNY